MSEFAHSASLQDKIEAELAAAFDDVSSDEEVDDRAYEAPHEKLQLKGWTKEALENGQKQRAKSHVVGQPSTASFAKNPFFRTGRLAATMLRAKNRFLLLHALSKLPRPLPTGWTPLHTACYVHDFKNMDAILTAVKKPSDASAALSGDAVAGITPLHLLLRPYSRIRARHTEEHTVAAVLLNARKLLACKADVNAMATGTLGDVLTNGSGAPLHQAMDRVKLVHLLLSAKANINAQNNDDNTPLNMCFENTVERLSVDSIAFLLESQADPNIQNNAGMNPVLRWANRRADDRPIEILNLLVQSRAMLNAETLLTREKAIHLVGSDVAVVFRLVELKANIDAQQRDGATRLHMAVKCGDDQLCRRLLNAGADINLPQTSTGRTPIAMVCEAGHLQLLHTFLKTSKDDRRSLVWEGPLEADVKAQFEVFKMRNKKPRRGQTAAEPTPNQREVLKVLRKHVAPCAIL
eukprot:INCI6204.1.p1 GENE.INCI6204.1~~INCI6204.1.p1  ORF type:complete len:465 (-),score=78.07 INCI6204.1:1795-3189(-)